MTSRKDKIERLAELYDKAISNGNGKISMEIEELIVELEND